jgi:tRNA (uracil-5-)-methyltransferase TRM9
LKPAEFDYRSPALVEIAKRHQPHNSIVADTLDLPHPDSSFDFAIAIAVIHHLSTTERRVQAIEALLRTIVPSVHGVTRGSVLIFVWALEQGTSRRGWDTGHEQDVMVPWVMKGKNGNEGDRAYDRYYHLYQAGELERDITVAGGTVIHSGYEKDNWWAIAVRKETPDELHLCQQEKPEREAMSMMELNESIQ